MMEVKKVEDEEAVMVGVSRETPQKKRKNDGVVNTITETPEQVKWNKIVCMCIVAPPRYLLSLAGWKRNTDELF